MTFCDHQSHDYSPLFSRQYQWCFQRSARKAAPPIPIPAAVGDHCVRNVCSLTTMHCWAMWDNFSPTWTPLLPMSSPNLKTWKRHWTTSTDRPTLQCIWRTSIINNTTKKTDNTDPTAINLLRQTQQPLQTQPPPQEGAPKVRDYKIDTSCPALTYK